MTAAAQDQHNGFLTKLQEIRDRLGSLRKDRTVYIKSNDVLEQYYLLCQQIRSVAHLDKDTDEQDGLSRSVFPSSKTCLVQVTNIPSLSSNYRLFAFGIPVLFDRREEQ